jgi:hypothetical protein
MAICMDQREAEREIAQFLLERVEGDRYPSATQMNLLEQSLTPDLADEYVEVLLNKLRQDRWPSLDIVRRLQRVAAALPQGG